MKLAVTIRELKFHIKLLDTPTAKALVAAAPFESGAQTWGELSSVKPGDRVRVEAA